MTKWIAALLLTLLVTMSVTTAYAHEAHRKDMSDAEMAEMKQAGAAERDALEAATESPVVTAVIPDPTNDEMSVDGHDEMMAEHHEAAAFSLTDFLGRLHPAIVHFPIALFLAAGLAEFLLFMRPASGLEPTIKFLIYTGAAGGVIATILGWLAGGIRMSDRSETLGLHRWTGTSIAVAGLVAAILIYRAKSDRTVLRVVIAGIAAALLFQGYWGAEMSMGPNHMGM